MIGFFDALTLACTKLRSKRVLLIITVVVSGLLFGVLSSAVFIATGVTQSTERFFTQALNGQYLVSAQPNIPNSVYGYDDSAFSPSKELIAKLTSLQDAYIAKQKAIYDKNKVPFDKTTIPSILQSDPYGMKDSEGKPAQIINRDSPVYQDYLKQLMDDYIKTSKSKVSDLKKLAGQYGATGYQHNKSMTLQGQSTYLKDGKESFGKKETNPSTLSYEDYLTSNVKDSSYVFTDQSLMQRFIYPDNAARKQNDAIPVILTTQEIVKMFGKELGIEKQPSEPDAQVAWVKKLQKKANGYTYSACYRSSSESELIRKTLQTNTEIADKKNDKNYTPPTLQYNLPSTPCGELTVKKDSRSTREKKEFTDAETLQKELGTYVANDRKLLKFQIVGSFTLASVDAQPQNATAYISYLLGPNYQQGAFIPQQLYDKLPATSQNKDLLLGTKNPFDDKALEDADIKNTVVSFSSLAAARDFIKNEGCEMFSTDCKKPFLLGTYGSSYLAVEEISSFISSIAPIALIISMSIAGIVIFVTMARVIIDSRRETAVFRALGAKRRDIAGVYILYSMLVASLIVVFMLGIGFIAGSIVEGLYSSQATNLAKVAYGVFDTLEPYHFIGINLQALAALAGCVFGISLLAVLPPLWRNVRRSPIRDMRDE